VKLVRLILTGIIVLVIASMAASASPVSKAIGPFNITFDLNTTLKYNVTAEDAQETSSSWIYQMLIQTDNRTAAQISVIEYKNLTDSTLSIGKILIEQSMSLMGFSRNISSIDMHKGSYKGFIFTGMNTAGMRLFRAYYWLDSIDCECGPVTVGKTEIGVISTYPLNESASLIKSLHVEAPRQKVDQMPRVFAPPK
jgi:hypothetical protein